MPSEDRGVDICSREIRMIVGVEVIGVSVLNSADVVHVDEEDERTGKRVDQMVG